MPKQSNSKKTFENIFAAPTNSAALRYILETYMGNPGMLSVYGTRIVQFCTVQQEHETFSMVVVFLKSQARYTASVLCEVAWRETNVFYCSG